MAVTYIGLAIGFFLISIFVYYMATIISSQISDEEGFDEEYFL
jgi:hypothetical protein